MNIVHSVTKQDSSNAKASQILDRNLCTTAAVAFAAGTGTLTLAVGTVVIPEIVIVGTVGSLALAEVGRRQYKQNSIDKVAESAKAEDAEASDA